jgi:hypothetical protein
MTKPFKSEEQYELDKGKPIVEQLGLRGDKSKGEEGLLDKMEKPFKSEEQKEREKPLTEKMGLRGDKQKGEEGILDKMEKPFKSEEQKNREERQKPISQQMGDKMGLNKEAEKDHSMFNKENKTNTTY